MGLGEPPRLGHEATQAVEKSAVLACNDDQAEFVYQSGMRNETNSVNILRRSQGDTIWNHIIEPCSTRIQLSKYVTAFPGW